MRCKPRARFSRSVNAGRTSRRRPTSRQRLTGCRPERATCGSSETANPSPSDGDSAKTAGRGRPDAANPDPGGIRLDASAVARCLRAQRATNIGFGALQSRRERCSGAGSARALEGGDVAGPRHSRTSHPLCWNSRQDPVRSDCSAGPPRGATACGHRGGAYCERRLGARSKQLIRLRSSRCRRSQPTPLGVIDEQSCWV
jgi:hypothetical protein